MGGDGDRHADVSASAAAIEQLRRHRVRPPRARDLSGDLGAMRAALARDQRRLGDIGAIWAELCPEDLVERTRVIALDRGALRVAVDDSAARYALDRSLRGGLTDRIIEASRHAVRRVKLELSG